MQMHNCKMWLSRDFVVRRKSELAKEVVGFIWPFLATISKKYLPDITAPKLQPIERKLARMSTTTPQTTTEMSLVLRTCEAKMPWGASRGIGRAIAMHLASRGANVLGTCASSGSLNLLESLEKTVQQGNHSSELDAPKVTGLVANLLSPDLAETIANKVQDEFGGKLNIIVNNATHFEARPVRELDAEFIQRVLVGNLQFLALMMDVLLRRDYIQPESRIVNISSDWARIAAASYAMLYASTKSAMESMTRSWAEILSQDTKTLGTTVNSLSVGGTATDALTGSAAPHMREAALKVLSEGKSIHNGVGLPEDVAKVVANGGSVKVL
ncbi:3-oxoacyl-(acyl-carrier-protein) reductase [Colletotrichum salicis]|uniref:3-oxoacyl-(Acyl-carrier-protein) reductase n=1 Tax=Colletotrichum salicis TaxID=1209931 RepID=A0A135UD90_9PEZI|nr:3-oxoacyl-(acyl-carrier-protein) reductase [Colletotrichum salicis]